jgi:hypothetical protein
MIYIRFEIPDLVDWQDEVGFDSWNLYEGDLTVLAAGGAFTQAPGSNDLADRQCGLADSVAADLGLPPAPGATAFFLVTGNAGTLESGLGTSSFGPRPNTDPCP